MNLWKIIAKNEIRLKTSKIRKHRTLFFISIYAFFLFWAAYLGPLIFDIIIPDAILTFSSVLGVILFPIIEYISLVIFMVFIFYPIFLLFRKSEIGTKLVILASPIKPGDVFLGEFLGQIPFYFLIVLAIGPLPVSILMQINHQLTVFHVLIIYLVMFLMMNFSLMIGSILANWIEHKIGTSLRLQKLRYPLLLLLSFGLVFSFYLAHFLYDVSALSPEIKAWFSIFPSYWFSNIILYVVNPLFIHSYIVNIWLSIILAISFPLALFYISSKKARKFYQLEPFFENSSNLSPDGNKYFNLAKKFLKKITIKKYRFLVLIQFKLFFRKKENVMKLIYTLIFTFVLGLFIYLNLNESLTATTQVSLAGFFIIPVVYFDILILSIIAWMGGLVFGLFMGITIMFDSKGIAYLYKKSLRGINSLIFSFLYQMAYMILAFDILLTISFTLLFSLDFLTMITFFGLYFFSCLIPLVQAIGYQGINPFYDERGKQVYFNVYFIALLQVISLLISLFIIMPFMPVFIDYSLGFLMILFLNLGISSIIALLLLIIGLRRLNNIQ